MQKIKGEVNDISWHAGLILLGVVLMFAPNLLVFS